MSKSKKIAVTAVLTALIILVCFIYTFINSTISEKKISDNHGSNAVYTQIVDGADFGCNHLKFKIETNSEGKSYLSFYQKAKFGFVYVNRYYNSNDFYELTDEIGFSFISMNKDYTEYSFVFFGNNSQQASEFELSLPDNSAVSRELDSTKPFACIFTDSDFDKDETVVNTEKTVRLLDNSDNVLYEQVI